MSEYRPDNWSIVRTILTTQEEPIYRVAAGWNGSYTAGRSWKLSSSIEKFAETELYVEFSNSSGSTYICYFDSVGLDWYTESVVKHYAGVYGEDDIVFEEITFEQFKKDWNG